MMASQLTIANAPADLTVESLPAAVHAAGYPTHTTVALAVPEQVPAGSAGTAAGSASLIIVLLIGFLLWRAIDKKKAKPSHIALAFTAGVLLSGSMVGVMAQQTAGSIGTGVTTMFSTVTTVTTGGTGGR